MIQSTSARKLFSALLVGFAVAGWILVNRYTTRPMSTVPSALGLHWLTITLYLGAIFGVVIVGLLTAFRGRIERTTLLVSGWNFALSAGLFILYFIASDPLAQSAFKEVGLDLLRWIFLVTGIVSLVASFLFFGRAVDATSR